MEKEAFCTPGKLDRGTHTTSIKFAGIVMTFESYLAPIFQRKSFCPVYAHHVVLIPLNHATIGITSTEPFVLAPCLVSGLSTAWSGNSPVSISIVGCLKWDHYDAEIRYRRKYGIRANLNKFLVTQKVIRPATAFKLYSENTITLQARGLTIYKCDNDLAYAMWEDRLVIQLETICKHFEPIIVD